MDYSLMSDKQLADLKEDKEIQLENTLDAIELAWKCYRSIDGYTYDDSESYLKDLIQSLEYQAECLKDEIEDIIEQMDADIWDNDYDERMNEYRKMQGF